MANLKVKKAQLSGPIEVGRGWLVTRFWAVLVADDKRFIDVATTNAAFAGLDVVEISEARVEQLARLLQSCEDGPRYNRTRVLIEGEDQTLTRVYYHERPIDCRPPEVPVDACIPEAFASTLGSPPELWLTPNGFFVTEAGAVARTTDEVPPWAMTVEP